MEPNLKPLRRRTRGVPFVSIAGKNGLPGARK
jgi:hypothetical protein